MTAATVAPHPDADARAYAATTNTTTADLLGPLLRALATAAAAQPTAVDTGARRALGALTSAQHILHSAVTAAGEALTARGLGVIR